MRKQWTYKASGVDIGAAEKFVKGIQKDIAGTLNPSVLRGRGAFGSLFALDGKKYQNPVLVSSTDGVGTKLLLAKLAGRHDTVGIDLVAMNVNDILCAGARPLFFLDYIACGRVKGTVLPAVVRGIARGCQMAGCALVGGETAEMPGLYAPDEYDLAGFAVGVVEKDQVIDGSGIEAGDCVIGLPSSGLHSNGFSLVRKVFSLGEQKKMAVQLLTPTRIYAREVLSLTGRFPVKGIAHVTGGAFYEKLTKILPQGMGFVIERQSWPVPKIFHIIQKKGKISHQEMFRTFNMGIGMAFVLAPADAARAVLFLKKRKIQCYEIGRVARDSRARIKFNPAFGG